MTTYRVPKRFQDEFVSTEVSDAVMERLKKIRCPRLDGGKPVVASVVIASWIDEMIANGKHEFEQMIWKHHLRQFGIVMLHLQRIVYERAQNTGKAKSDLAEKFGIPPKYFAIFGDNASSHGFIYEYASTEQRDVFRAWYEYLRHPEYRNFVGALMPGVTQEHHWYNIVFYTNLSLLRLNLMRVQRQQERGLLRKVTKSILGRVCAAFDLDGFLDDYAEWAAQSGV